MYMQLPRYWNYFSNIVKSLLVNFISDNEPAIHNKSGRWDIATEIWGYTDSWDKYGIWIKSKCQHAYGVTFDAYCSIIPEGIQPATLNLHQENENI